jgi:hypothetical protein
MAVGSRVRLATRRGQGAPSEAYVGVTAAIEGYAINPIWFVSVPKLSRDLALSLRSKFFRKFGFFAF